MKANTLTALLIAALAGFSTLRAQQPPEMPAPTKEHQWLAQFVGEWESDVEVYMEPDKPPMKCKSIDISRMIGGFWVVGEGKGEMMGMQFSNVLTLGYDPGKKKFIGTWIDSMTSYLWKYEGSVDATGKILTLDTEGPCPMKPGTTTKFKEVTEFKSKDERVFTSTMLGEDGKWVKMVTVTSRRKK